MRSLRRSPARTLAALAVGTLSVAALSACGGQSTPTTPLAATSSMPSVAAATTTTSKTTAPGPVKDVKATAGTVTLRANGKPWCSGVRIAPTWVATARHCVQDPKTNKRIAISGVYTSTVTTMAGPYTKVKSVHPAPNGDLALIELAKPSPGKIVGLAPKKSVLVNAPVTVMQWNTTNVLVASDAKIKHREKGKTYGGQSYVVNCATECPDATDSGAPLIVNGYVAGVLSWGTKSEYSGYTCMDTLLDWIVKVTHVTVQAPETYHEIPDYHSPDMEDHAVPLPDHVFIQDIWHEEPLPWAVGQDDDHNGMSDHPEAAPWPDTHDPFVDVESWQQLDENGYIVDEQPPASTPHHDSTPPQNHGTVPDHHQESEGDVVPDIHDNSNS